MNIFLFPLLFLALISNVFMGITSLAHDMRNPVNRAWSMVVFSVSLWITGMTVYFALQSSSEFAETAIKFASITPLFIPLALLYFVYAFTEQLANIRPWQWVLSSIPTFILIWLILFTDTIIKEFLTRTSAGEPYVVWGDQQWLYVLYKLIYFGWPLVLLIRFYFQSNGLVRTKAALVLTSVSVSTVIGVTCNLVLPSLNIFNYLAIGPIGTIAMIALTTYTIMRYHLFGMRFIANKAFVWVGLGIIAYTFYYGISYFYTQVFSTAFDPQAYVRGLGVAVAFAVALVNPITKQLQVVADRIFYQGYNPHQHIETILSSLKDASSLRQFHSILHRHLQRAFSEASIDTIVFIDDVRLRYYSVADQQYAPSLLQRLRTVSSVRRTIITQDDDIFRDSEHVDAKLLIHLNARVVLPFFQPGHIDPIGMVMIGGTSSPHSYYQEDVSLLEYLRKETSPTFNRLFSEYVLNVFDGEAIKQLA